MKHDLGYLGIALISVFIIAIISQFISSNYITTLTETKPSEAPSPPSAVENPTSTSTSRIIENPNGTKTVIVEISQITRMADSVSGQHFNSRKYTVFVIAAIIKEKTFDLVKDIRERYLGWIALFVAAAAIPTLLLALITQKKPFLR